MLTENTVVLQATIASGGSLSSEVLCQGGALLRIEMPSGWDAAPLSFQVDSDGSGYRSLVDMDDDSEILCPKSGNAAADEAYSVSTEMGLVGLMRLKIQSGAKASAVNQTADRVITLVVAV